MTGGPEIKVPLFQGTEAQPQNGDIQKSWALAASQVFFISSLSSVGARVFPYFRLLVCLALENVFKDKTRLELAPYKAVIKPWMENFHEKMRGKNVFFLQKNR